MKDGSIAYTRNGEFVIDNETNELTSINGWKLFDALIIRPGFTELIINEDHAIITRYSNGEEIHNGYLNIYTLDTNKLEYFDAFFMTRNNIFQYFGTEEKICDDKILNEFLEGSNVLPIATRVRLIIISQLLGIEWDK